MYLYSIKILKAIALQYASIYSGLLLDDDIVVMDIFSLAEYKADFDTALQAIGKDKWIGDIDNRSFKDFKYYSHFQRIVIADIFGLDNFDYLVPKERNHAYYLMTQVLNGGNIET